MKVKYIGKKKVYKSAFGQLLKKPSEVYDFSEGPIEVPDALAKALVRNYPKTFSVVQEEAPKE